MGETIGNRIDALIHDQGLKRMRVAELLNLDQSYVTQLASGKRNPSDRTIADICRVFHVNEVWLRTGEGSMYREITRDEEISAFIETALSGESDSFKKRLLGVLSRLDESQWELLEQMAEALAAGKREPETK